MNQGWDFCEGYYGLDRCDIITEGTDYFYASSSPDGQKEEYPLCPPTGA